MGLNCSSSSKKHDDYSRSLTPSYLDDVSYSQDQEPTDAFPTNDPNVPRTSFRQAQRRPPTGDSSSSSSTIGTYSQSLQRPSSMSSNLHSKHSSVSTSTATTNSKNSLASPFMNRPPASLFSISATNSEPYPKQSVSQPSSLPSSVLNDSQHVMFQLPETSETTDEVKKKKSKKKKKKLEKTREQMQMMQQFQNMSYNPFMTPNGANFLHSPEKERKKKKKKKKAKQVPDPAQWSVEMTCMWLSSLGDAYEDYSTSFLRNGVNGALLAIMTEDDYRTIGIDNHLHIKKIQMELETLMGGSVGKKKKMKKKKRKKKDGPYGAALTKHPMPDPWNQYALHE